MQVLQGGFQPGINGLSRFDEQQDLRFRFHTALPAIYGGQSRQDVHAGRKTLIDKAVCDLSGSLRVGTGAKGEEMRTHGC